MRGTSIRNHKLQVKVPVKMDAMATFELTFERHLRSRAPPPGSEGDSNMTAKGPRWGFVTSRGARGRSLERVARIPRRVLVSVSEESEDARERKALQCAERSLRERAWARHRAEASRTRPESDKEDEARRRREETNEAPSERARSEKGARTTTPSQVKRTKRRAHASWSTSLISLVEGGCSIPTSVSHFRCNRLKSRSSCGQQLAF